MAEEKINSVGAETAHQAGSQTTAVQPVSSQTTVAQPTSSPTTSKPREKRGSRRERTRLDPKRVLAALGPGMVAALAGADAGGVATYSNAGALFGFAQLWTVPVMCFLLIVVQETAARMGCVTGKGFASLIRERFGVRGSALAMLALLVSNTTVTLSEFAGIASGLGLFGVPTYLSVPISAIAIWLLTMSGSYNRIEKILLAISCVFVTYIVAGIMVGPDWGAAARDTLIPQFVNDPRYFSLLVANIGTTIAPWMIFLAQSNVVEKNAREDDIPYQRIDTVTGSVVASIISWFIILATGHVLFPAGIVVEGAEDAAAALAPLAGPYAQVLFGAGLVGASFLAACVLPGITASAICEAFGWERGADRSWQEAPTYRGIITAILVISAAVVLIPNVNLFGIMMVAQVINGVLLPVLLVCMVTIARDRHIMGTHANGRLWTGLTWFTIVAVTVFTIIMFVLQALGF
jgi:NRAMP (natural resistance-associated macrophage protein)-like metal ion transporter